MTVLDAGVVIALLERRDVHRPAARSALADARKRGDRIILPASAYSEALVGAIRTGSEARAKVDQFLDELPALIEPVSRSIAAEAAHLRASHGRALRLPDALVLATARVLDAERVVTTDTGLPDIGLRVDVIGT
ncbi:MAG TPA: PIN domain-containing protein [Candidatus Sulfomarinibacteraceae bacterium]|nr:PIN domain-containing protein [Candidatus Sulfomarinibacteraceae bacterium]